MAEQSGNFKQTSNLFSAEGPVSQFVTNVYEFSDNLSDVISDVLSFLNIAVVFLRKIKSPLEYILIPVLESLESYLESLKYIGAGTLTVWPWEVGKNPNPINFDGLLEGYEKFLNYYFGEQGRVPIINPILLSDGTSLLPDAESTIEPTTNKKKEDVLESLQSLKNFLDLDSSYWVDSDFGEILKTTRTFLNKRELTPAQVIQKINDSFDDLSDEQRPQSSGDYVAFVMIAALPSFSGLNQVITEFSNFFGGVFDAMTPDGKKTAQEIVDLEMINLGDPVILKNNKVDTNSFYINNVKNRPNIPDGVYEEDNDIIPMFKKGDLITQTHDSIFSQNFSAIVEKHHNIIVKNGKIIQNNVLVKDVNGKIKENHSTNSSSNPGILRKNQNTGDTFTWPLFKPGDSINQKVKEDVYDFIATVTNNSLKLTDVFPNIRDGKELKFTKKIKQLAKDGIDVYNHKDPKDLYRVENRNLMIDFVQNLSPGKSIQHPFFKTLEGGTTLNDHINNASDDSGLVKNSKKLLKLIPGFGINYHIKEVLIENTETGNIAPLNRLNVEKQLFRFKNAEDSHKDTVEKKVVGMNKIILKLGRLLGDGTIDDSASILNSAVTTPGDKVEFFNFSNIAGNTFIPSIKMFTTSNAIPPNWKFLTINDFLPEYGEMIDTIIEFIHSGKGWLKTASGLIDEAIKFLEDLSQWLQETNQKLLNVLRFLTTGLNSAGLYSLTISGGGGSKGFKSKLSSAKFEQLRANPYPSIELETVQKESTVINPITGLEEVVTTNVLKPALKPPDQTKTSPDLLSASDLNDLKYSFGVVFYAQGDDSQALKQFISNFDAARTYSESFFSFLTGTNETIADKIIPYVNSIQVSDVNGNFVDAENATVSSNFKIRVIFTNNAHTLTDKEISLLAEIEGRSVDISPKVNTSILHLSEEDTINGKSEFTLTQDGNYILLKNPPSISTTIAESGQQYFNCDFEPIDQLTPTEPGDSPYKFSAVVNPLTTFENMKVETRYDLKVGFNVIQTSILNVELK